MLNSQSDCLWPFPARQNAGNCIQRCFPALKEAGGCWALGAAGKLKASSVGAPWVTLDFCSSGESSPVSPALWSADASEPGFFPLFPHMEQVNRFSCYSEKWWACVRTCVFYKTKPEVGRKTYRCTKCPTCEHIPLAKCICKSSLLVQQS